MTTPTTDPGPRTDEADAGADQDRGSLADRLARRTGPDGVLGRLDTIGAGVLDNPRRTLGVALGLVALLGLVVSDINLGRIIVVGAGDGAVYSLIALGLVLVYSSTRVLNFAQGEFGTVPAFVVLFILLGGDLLDTVDPANVSFARLTSLTLLAVLIGAGLAIAVNLFVIQRLADSSAVTSLVATAGVSLLLVGGQFLVFEAQARRFPRFIDGAPCLSRNAEGDCLTSLSAFGFVISWHILVIAAVLGIVAVLLAALLRTPVGVALVASAQEPYAASLHGVSPRAMSSLAWGLAGGLGALAGVLGAGVFDRITPGQMTSNYLIPAFTAAVLGGLTSMTGAVVGGLLLGIAGTLTVTVVDLYQLSNIIPSGSTFAAFVVLLTVLLVRPNGLFGKA